MKSQKQSLCTKNSRHALLIDSVFKSLREEEEETLFFNSFGFPHSLSDFSQTLTKIFKKYSLKIDTSFLSLTERDFTILHSLLSRYITIHLSMHLLKTCSLESDLSITDLKFLRSIIEKHPDFSEPGITTDDALSIINSVLPDKFQKCIDKIK